MLQQRQSDWQRERLRGGRIDHADAADGKHEHSRHHGRREDQQHAAAMNPGI